MNGFEIAWDLRGSSDDVILSLASVELLLTQQCWKRFRAPPALHRSTVACESWMRRILLRVHLSRPESLAALYCSRSSIVQRSFCASILNPAPMAEATKPMKPTWYDPSSTLPEQNQPQLRVLNSLTKEKVLLLSVRFVFC